MPLATYRITVPSLVIAEERGNHIVRKIPAGMFVSVDSEKLDGNILVHATWDGQKIIMYTRDLKARAEAAPKTG